MWTEVMCVTARPGTLSRLKEEKLPLPRSTPSQTKSGNSSFDCGQRLKLEGVFMMASGTTALANPARQCCEKSMCPAGPTRSGLWLNVTEDGALNPIK